MICLVFRLDAGSSRVSFAVQLELVLLLLFVLLKLELCGSLVMLPDSVPGVDHSITLFGFSIKLGLMPLFEKGVCSNLYGWVC